MSLISPTTVFVAGSISITLSPAALVCTMRTVDAESGAPAARSASDRTYPLVCIAGYFKLRSHVGDPLFLPARPGAAPAGQPRLRGVQDHGAAAPARKAARARALLRLSLDRHRLPSAGA